MVFHELLTSLKTALIARRLLLLLQLQVPSVQVTVQV
jgi:hypothetical protein